MRPEQILAKPGAPVIALRQLDLSVLEPYLRMLADPEGRRLTATTTDFTRAQIIQWLGSRAMTPNRRDWAIVDGAGTFLGEVVLNEFDDSKNSMNIRIALAGPELFGQSIGRQAMTLALMHAFDELALTKVTLEVLIDNARARRSYESVGFAAGREFNDKKLRFLRMAINKQQFVTALAHGALIKYLQPGWSFALDSGKRRAGLCNYTDRRISISKHHVEVHSVDESLQVLAHELGHALSGKNAGHSKVWLAAAKSLGYRAEKFSGTEIAREKAAWVGVCPNGHEHFRYRKPTRPLSCGVCSRGFSTANLIAWRANEPEV
jgi:RimJ/RimL family protein N-acetyltransferase